MEIVEGAVSGKECGTGVAVREIAFQVVETRECAC
jgi:hypothetical protein